MPQDKRNVFGHPSIAKPNVPNERLAQMNHLLNQEEHEDVSQERAANTMISSDLEQLVFLGKIQDSKIINGFKFNMHTLTGREQNDVWLSVSYLNNDTKFFLIKVAFLARAIDMVNGRSLDLLYKEDDYRELTKEQRCVRVVETWQQPLIDELYDFYSDLVDRSRKEIKPEEIKKS